MTETEAADAARRMTDPAIRTVYPSHVVSGRHFALEACAYATERADAYAKSNDHGVDHPMVIGYLAVAREYAAIAAKQTRALLDAALA